jgi:type II secretory pathway component GspD/PulD (secretin)
MDGSMPTFHFACVACLCLVLGLGTDVGADPPIPGSGPFADGKVIQASGSGTIASRMLQKTSFEVPSGQIKFEVQILSVDSATRDKIYASLGVENVQTQITKIDDVTDTADADTLGDDLSSRHMVATGSIVSSAVMTEEQVQSLHALVKQSDTTRVIARPQIISGDGLSAAMQQQVQRPFLSNLKAVKQGDVEAIQSEIQVFSEGTDITVQADIVGDTLNVRTKIQQSRVADVQLHRVYGIGEGQSTIQVPSHEVREATAVATLTAKQSLLLDPYFQSKVRSESTSGTPILTKIPYLQKSFKRTEAQEVTMNTIVLLKAKKL